MTRRRQPRGGVGLGCGGVVGGVLGGGLVGGGGVGLGWCVGEEKGGRGSQVDCLEDVCHKFYER